MALYPAPYFLLGGIWSIQKLVNLGKGNDQVFITWDKIAMFGKDRLLLEGMNSQVSRHAFPNL